MPLFTDWRAAFALLQPIQNQIEWYSFLMTQEKITAENINAPDQLVQVRADKYQDMHNAILKALPDSAPGSTFNEIVETVKIHLSPKLFPDGKSSGWWAKTVQLDLEAKAQIIRSNTKPLRFYRA